MKAKAKSDQTNRSHEMSRRFSNPKPTAKIIRRKTPWSTSTTLERACDVLRLFTPQKPRWTISELARHLNVPKSGVFRLVKTDRKSTRLNSSHVRISYAVFCLKKKKKHTSKKTKKKTKKQNSPQI